MEAWRPVAWANGGGITHELARAGPDGAPSWRVSVADINRDGPFSSFPGIDRQTVLIGGSGFRLGQSLVWPIDPIVTFPGEAAVNCTLIDGSVRVLNVMTRRDRSRAAVAVIRLSGSLVVGKSARPLVAIALAGSVEYATLALWPHDSFLANGPVRLTGAGRVAVVRIDDP